jgi:DNA polymerase-1
MCFSLKACQTKCRKKSTLFEQKICKEEIQQENSNPLREIFFDKLKLGGAKQKKTKTGQYATGEEVLLLTTNNDNCTRYSRMAPNG